MTLSANPRQPVPSMIFARVPDEHRALFREERLRTNLVRMHVFSIYIVVLQILLNIINILKPADTKSSNIIIYIMLSMGTLLMGAVYWGLFALIRRGRLNSPALRQFLVQSLIYFYTVIQLTFCTLNIISTGGINSYIIAILIIGLVPVLPPAQSIFTILGAATYTLGAMYFTRSVSGAWDSILLTDLWTNLIIITGLTVCISVFIHNMYVANFLKEVRLRRANDTLEATVQARTRELEAQTEAAQIASRAKSDFLGRMSHEIRTPLNAIIGMTHIARKAPTLEKAVGAIAEIDKASIHLLDIVSDVLDMSEIDSFSFALIDQPFSLRTCLDEVAASIELRSYAKHLTFSTDHVALEDITLIGDEDRFSQVLLNLLGNAVKFTHAGGSVSLHTAITEEDSESLRLDLAIADTGIGMSEEQIEGLFIPFEQADANIAVRFGGAGLGLAICRILVDKMGGSIGVESQLGVGSVFRLSIPFKKSEAHLPPRNDSVPDLAGKRILVVEDIEINRIILSELLRETNATIAEAENGQAALEAIEQAPPGTYDLVFMDIQMPVMDGYEAARRIRAIGRPDTDRLPILAMTANAYRADAEKAQSAGMNGHIPKPIDLPVVLRTLREKLL